ncbi:MAG: restriction endonuclease subunit S [Lentisphaerae bacterium]|nr:restriction endonuclease subunit S [Lentisphaerota bacterium]
MPETLKRPQVFRFDQMAVQVKDKIDPAEAQVDRYVGLEHIAPESLKIRRWGDTSEVESSKIIFKTGDIIFGKRRAYQRKLAVADFDGICSAHAMVLRPKTDVVLEEFLPFFMQSDIFMERAVKISVGGLSPTINWRDLAKEEFALPPLNEQQRIAEALGAADSVAQKMEELSRALRSAFASRLEHYLVTAGDSVPSIPVADLLSEPPRNGLSPTTNADELGFMTVSISAVSNGRFDPTGNIKFAEAEHDKVAPFFVEEGDTFAVRGNGNRYITGKVGIAGRSYKGLFYPDLLIRLRFDEDRILRGFALAQWNLPSVHRRLISRAKSSNGIWKVNGQDVRAHSLLVPGLPEQRRLLGELGAIEERQEECERRKTSAVNMKAAIMEQLRGRRGA